MSEVGGAQPGGFEGGTVGGGRYQLRDLLGAGGMASVHLAYDSVLDRQVAVKTLHSELGREAAFRERFRREAQAVAKLAHTNIVSVYDSGEDTLQGAVVPYIVMEYVDGKPLRTELDEDIRRHGAMPTEKALKITGDVLAALDASHELGLVHRDIKPGNVMMTRRGVVKVMDFGIARAMESGVTSMTQTGMVVGTPQYLSPEQALGRGVDARSDLYTVGIMLFELLTGRLPFDADSPLAIAYAHVQEEPVAPSSINRSVPPAADAIVARALRKNPNERFPTAEAMRAECARVAGSGAAAGAAPVIVSGGPAPGSGAGVAQSVFPPVSATGTPPPPSTLPMGGMGGQGMGGQPAGAQGGYAAPYGQPQGGYGPSTPPPGHPQGYATPPPAYGYPHPQGPATPPPQGTPGAGGGGRGNRGVLMIALAGVTALVIIAAVVAVNLLNDGGDDPVAKPTQGATEEPGATEGPGGEPGPDPDPTLVGDGQDGEGEDDGAGFKDEDKTKTIDAEECTEAYDYNWGDEEDEEDNRVSMPDLTFHHIDSVKDCVREAGWVLDTDLSYEDENIYGKNTVLKQSPKPYEAFDPDEDKVKLVVSTGNAG
ncbi:MULTISPECIES: Stk1 family PASTA domain-containing Ser/Thr kinase [Streptomyces]|uniref:Stk1 family PASTA domain-containing Ser/Thr kinase n=1 Tax=Streptomyces TaxID=1883 RepID=UPI002249851D|nr:Stk1 family PASTA domain-containing Ser/Thr kinase [Streptomyces sp. JHD 1]MCX2968066.1 protein kinase [Streptomyces sp. JHD 1]